LIVCNIEEPQAVAESWIEDVHAFVEFENSPIELLAQVLEDKGLHDRRIGIELGYLSARLFAELSDLLPKATFVSCDGLFSQARIVKTPAEIELLGRAARATEEALMETLSSVRPGDTEKSMANRLASSLLDNGAGEIIFLYINAGPNTGFPHCRATDYRARMGDVVKSDVGGYFDGYLSDVARTAFLGRPSDEARSIYERLIQVHHETIAAAVPGNTAAQVFFTARKAYASVDLNFPLPHAGHSVGIAAHEWPMLSPAHDVELLPDTLLYIESRVRWPGKVGYHIEDLIHVTMDGPRVLTTAFPSDELFII
jgi:Xaa-Pro aminopeptidase